MAAQICDSHAQCYTAFQSLLEALDRPARDFRAQLPPKTVDEEFDKYKIWAGNVGAAHRGRRYEISLDYRLREASFIKKQVLSLLDSLEDKLNQATSLVRNERHPFEEEEKDQNSDETDLSSSNALEDSSAAEDSPWEISSDSGQSDSSAHDQVPQSNTPLLGSKKSTLAPKASSPNIPILHLGRTPTAEMPRLLESIKFTIGCLYKIPIRKPAPLDRIKHRTSLDSSSYQHFDVLYVMDKFKGINEQLAARLGKAITQRRQILYYREAHKEGLETTRLKPLGPPTSALEVKQTAPPGDSRSTVSSQATISQAASSQFTLQSKATTLQPRELEHVIFEEPGPEAFYTPSVAESKSSFASSYAGKELAVIVPPRPKGDYGIELDWFECPYCLITKHITSERRWKKHVLEDLQPYVCTYEDCNLQDYFFEDQDSWYKHEMLQHRIKWFCNIEKHPEYSSECEFLKHLDNAHDQNLGWMQADLLRDMFSRPSRDTEGHCNLCKRWSTNLRSHVSRHLQQMALFALPRLNETSGSGVAERATQNSARYKTEGDKGSASNASDSSSEANTGDVEDITVDRLSMVDSDEQFEAVLVPDTPEASWYNITDKFGRPQESPPQQMHILFFNQSSSRGDEIESQLRTIGCRVTASPALNEPPVQFNYDIAVFCFPGSSTLKLLSIFAFDFTQTFPPTLAILTGTVFPGTFEGYFDVILEAWSSEDIRGLDLEKMLTDLHTTKERQERRERQMIPFGHASPSPSSSTKAVYRYGYARNLSTSSFTVPPPSLGSDVDESEHRIEEMIFEQHPLDIDESENSVEEQPQTQKKEATRGRLSRALKLLSRKRI